MKKLVGQKSRWTVPLSLIQQCCCGGGCGCCVVVLDCNGRKEDSQSG